MKGVLIVFIKSYILEYKTYLYVDGIGGNGDLKKKIISKVYKFCGFVFT